MIHRTEKICPKCDAPKMSTWADLTDEQRMLAASLPLSAEYTRKERERHRFCTHCWFEQAAPQIEKA